MKNNIYLPQPIQPIKKPAALGNKKNMAAVSTDFSEILDSQLGVQFSKHALDRLEKRKINIDKISLERLNNAVNKASAKGAKESLILMGDLALVVSVKNKMVITAVDGANIKENVFTNIDSAVIV